MNCSRLVESANRRTVDVGKRMTVKIGESRCFNKKYFSQLDRKKCNWQKIALEFLQIIKLILDSLKYT